MPNDIFHPTGSGISHLSIRSGRLLRLEVHRQNRVQYVIFTCAIRVILRPDAIELT
jgi:hypothetical protein